VLKQRWFKIMLFVLFSGSLSAQVASTFVFNAQNTPDIIRAVNFARNNQKPVIIEDANDSTTHNNGAVYLHLNDFKQMITLHLKDKTMLVQSGMTWNQAQQLVAPFGLSLKFIPAVANEPIIATINYNQSGLSPQNPLVADGVESLRLLQPDGRVVDVSPDTTPQLWRGLFGAQGTLGVVLDVQLKLVKNQHLIRQAERMSYRDYTAYLRDQVQDNPDISASFARLDVAPGKDFLNDIYTVSYWVKDSEAVGTPELHPVRNKIASSVYQWSEKGDWEKGVRWQIEKALLGNNRLHPDTTRADLLLRQTRGTNAQQRYVYYIPAAQFVPFIDNLRTVALKQKWSFNQISAHYLAKPNDFLLPPRQGDTLAIVISFSTSSLSVAAQKAMATTLNNLASNHGGNSALMKLTYPQFAEFQKLKGEYDPQNLFMSALL
jgi:decaprenylphospho-beta-D-ribofuranose 2-oxidase